VETRTIGKILGAFLAGVVLALGGAILYSRQVVLPDPVRPVLASSTTLPSTPSVPEAPGPATVREPAPENRDELPPQEPRKPKTPVAVERIKPSTSATVAEVRTPVQPARPLPGEVPSELSGNGQLSPPTASPALPPVVEKAPVTPSTSDSAFPSRSRPAEPPQDSPSPQQPHVVTLPAGTTLAVRLRESLDSERNASGDPFQATLDAPVITEGFIIADRRSKVLGQIIQANRAGRVKGLANLRLALSEINTTDGQRVAVQTDSYEKWGNSSVKGDTAKVAGGAALGAIIGAIAGGGKGAAIGAGAGGAAGTGVALGTRGTPVSVPSESIITFRLARPVTITEKFN
jgi:hypothetical protein